jgi:nitrogenase molybdenum-iron protein alpha chain
LKSPPPYGFAGADIWLRDIGKVTGREAAVETLIEREHARVRPRIAELKAKLQGLRVFLGMGEGFAHGLIAVLGELGVNVVGALNFHHDIIYDGVDKQDITIAHLLKHYGDVKPFSVANGQPHRFAALLHQVKPDLVIVRHGVLNALSSRLGIPTMPLEGDSTLPFGYQGMINIGEELLSQLSQRRFHKSLAAHVRLPYRKEWLASQTQGEPLLERVA